MEAIKRRLENNYATRIIIENHQDPGDGSIHMSAEVFDGYTNESLVCLDWYYDFDELVRDLNQKIENLQGN